MIIALFGLEFDTIPIVTPNVMKAQTLPSLLLMSLDSPYWQQMAENSTKCLVHLFWPDTSEPPELDLIYFGLMHGLIQFHPELCSRLQTPFNLPKWHHITQNFSNAVG